MLVLIHYYRQSRGEFGAALLDTWDLFCLFWWNITQEFLNSKHLGQVFQGKSPKYSHIDPQDWSCYLVAIFIMIIKDLGLAWAVRHLLLRLGRKKCDHFESQKKVEILVTYIMAQNQNKRMLNPFCFLLQNVRWRMLKKINPFQNLFMSLKYTYLWTLI